LSPDYLPIISAKARAPSSDVITCFCIDFILQVRTRGSIKRRPPSRRFRRSQSDCGVDLGDLGAAESSQENGAKEEDSDEVFGSKSKGLESPQSGNRAMGRELRRKLESDDKPLLRRSCSMTENPTEKNRTLEEAKSYGNSVKNQEEKQQTTIEDDGEPQKAIENKEETTCENSKGDKKETSLGDSGGDSEEKTNEVPSSEKEETSEKTEEDEEEKPGQKNIGAKDRDPQQRTTIGADEERPQNTPEEKEGDNISEPEKDKEENEQKESISEKTDNQEITHDQGSTPGAEHSQPVTNSETTNEASTVQSTCSAEDDTKVQDTKM
ncbi:capZ-interacting protein-like, partial [Gracilinanus agilis]|uniref:capZ-interacting protein-like n=1 Tax=Gracilinanus agilis TaxID=191870 RepID=UPI001CFD8F98